MTPVEIRAVVRLGIPIFYRGFYDVKYDPITGEYCVDRPFDKLDPIFDKKGEFKRECFGLFPRFKSDDFGLEFNPGWYDKHAAHPYP